MAGFSGFLGFRCFWVWDFCGFWADLFVGVDSFRFLSHVQGHSIPNLPAQLRFISFFTNPSQVCNSLTSASITGQAPLGLHALPLRSLT